LGLFVQLFVSSWRGRRSWWSNRLYGSYWSHRPDWFWRIRLRLHHHWLRFFIYTDRPAITCEVTLIFAIPAAETSSAGRIHALCSLSPDWLFGIRAFVHHTNLFVVILGQTYLVTESLRTSRPTINRSHEVLITTATRMDLILSSIVVHHRIVVIGNFCEAFRRFFELTLPGLSYVTPIYANMSVTIRAILFVFHAQSMADFVDGGRNSVDASIGREVDMVTTPSTS